MRALPVFVSAILILGFTQMTSAADMKSPAGPVILTVAGSVSAANRSAFDEQNDAFFRYHDQTFDKAVVFDRAMLEELGVTEIRIAYQDWQHPITFSGPLLVDVLKAAGCSSGPLRTLALDGFATEISAEDVGARNWVLATRANGRPHGIGGRGPLWLVFDPPGNRPATEEEENMWPWALFFVRCG
ncbi:MAG: hypothetical protein OXG16_05840 [Rhodospirillales bacterium]|nr:hypothetical protein [Rhodospirillales bacterium]MDE0710529.1 hypothetical protein [Rhodospirillales bacterium]